MKTPSTTPTSALVDLLFDEDVVGRCLVAPDGTVLRANGEWLRSTGFDLEDVLGSDIIELFPATRDMAIAMHARARAGHRIEVPRHAQVIDGRERWWEGSIAPLHMDGGTGLLITAREVTPASADADHNRNVAEVDRRAREMEATFASMADGAILYGPGGRITAMNRAAEDILGFTREEYVAAGSLGERAALVDVRTPDGAPFPVEAVPAARAMRGETVRGVSISLRSRDGETRWVSASAAPVRNRHGTICGAVATFRDITVLTRAENALRESEQRYRIMGETLPYGVWLCNPQGGAEYVSQSFLDLLEMTQDEMREFGWTHRASSTTCWT